MKQYIKHLIVTLSFMISIQVISQTDSRFELTQAIETKIEEYVNDRIDSFQLSSEKLDAIQVGAEHENLTTKEKELYIKTVKRFELRLQYFEAYPNDKKAYLVNVSHNSNKQSLVNCSNGGFELGAGQYQFYSRVNWSHPGGNLVNLGANIPNDFSLTAISAFLDSNTNATLVTPGFEPTLFFASGGNVQIPKVLNGNRALRLNPTNGNQQNTSIMTRQFTINEPILSLNFSFLAQKPQGHPTNKQPFVRFEVFDLILNTVVDSRVITADNSGAILNDIDNSPWRYTDWSCLNLDVSQSIGNNVELRAIISDCSYYQHDAILYLDDICNNGTICNTSLFGNLFLNPQGINCPSTSFDVCGNYNTPESISSTPTITLDIIDSNGSSVQTISNPTIDSSTGTFCFTVNPSDFGTNPTGNFEFSATATFTNANNETITIEDNDANAGADVSFNECTDPCDTITESTVGATELSWISSASSFEIEFVSDYRCLPNADNNTDSGPEISISYSLTNTSINLNTVWADLNNLLSTLKAMRYRIRTNCSEWSDWCCIYPSSEVGTEIFTFQNTFDTCFPNNPCEDLTPITLNSPNDDINTTTGDIDHINHETIVASNLIEPTLASMYEASQSIRLVPGFHAKHGSQFIAKIKECVDIEIVNPPETRSANHKIYTKPSLLHVYPNPASNKITIAAKDNNINTVELLDIYGNRILNYQNIKVSNYNLIVDNLSRGYYVIKVLLDNGEIEYKNVILK